MALISAEQITKKGRSTYLNKPVLVHEGEEIAETGYKVSVIEPGKVKLKDHKGMISVRFDLTSESSMKRAQAIQKKEVKTPVKK